MINDTWLSTMHDNIFKLYKGAFYLNEILNKTPERGKQPASPTEGCNIEMLSVIVMC